MRLPDAASLTETGKGREHATAFCRTWMMYRSRKVDHLKAVAHSSCSGNRRFFIRSLTLLGLSLAVGRPLAEATIRDLGRSVSVNGWVIPKSDT